jgi:hypothetical protein
MHFLAGHVPKLHPSSMMGVIFSEKSWTYLLAGQLMFCDGISSFSSAIIGLLIGYIYDNNMFNVQVFRLPRSIEVRFQT